jgi:hypothetical protein
MGFKDRKAMVVQSTHNSSCIYIMCCTEAQIVFELMLLLLFYPQPTAHGSEQ